MPLRTESNLGSLLYDDILSYLPNQRIEVFLSNVLRKRNLHIGTFYIAHIEVTSTDKVFLCQTYPDHDPDPCGDDMRRVYTRLTNDCLDVWLDKGQRKTPCKLVK